GPWYNAEGVLVASNIADLHSNNRINAETALTEAGNRVPANQHDILTGSTRDGMLFAEPPLMGTAADCQGWTSSDDGVARVGHHDGERDWQSAPDQSSWNSDHFSIGHGANLEVRGCTDVGLRSEEPVVVNGAGAVANGAGLFYCFAATGFVGGADGSGH
ncbi:MAG TPA: hypothetical protein VK524_05150, partial [Polyangiaceae bacterium]|nr:hypothetical protein [Polyangiaceae bacterium]